jgi:hypothetical protein
LIGTGASHGWSHGGLAMGIGGSFAGWLIGGLATSQTVVRLVGERAASHLGRMTVAWGLAFFVSFAAAWWLGELFEELNSKGFLGLIVGAGLGGALGGLGSALAGLRSRSRSGIGGGRASTLVIGWAAGFGLGFWVALIATVFLGEAFKRALEPAVGWYPGLVLGSGVTGALGGAVAGVIGKASLAEVYGGPP